MASKEIYHNGLDIKSLAINLATLLLFFLPFAMYFYPEFKNEEMIAVAVGMVLAYFVPPIGSLRPHPYSDIPSNKPFAPRMTFTEHAIKQS